MLITRQRTKDASWNIYGNVDKDGSLSLERTGDAHLCVLMDIRDELKKINNILGCGNCVDIPNILRRIDKNTRKKRRPRAKKGGV